MTARISLSRCVLLGDVHAEDEALASVLAFASAGGVYWVPRMFSEDLRRLERAVRNIGSSQFHIVPVHNSDDATQTLGAVARGSLEAELAALQEEIESFKSEPPERTSTLERRLSTDDTGNVLAAVAREEPRLRIISSPPRGLVAALERGLRECRAPFIARMDADDESLPERLERSVAALEADPRLAVVGTQVEIVRADRPPSPNLAVYARWLSSLTTPEQLARERFIESPLCHPSTMIRHDVLEQHGAWRDGDFAEDYELWLRLLDRGERLKAISPVLLHWSDSDARATRTDARYRRESFAPLKAIYLARLIGGQRTIVCGAGPVGLALFRALRRQGVEVEALVDVDPDKIGQRVDGVPVRASAQLERSDVFLLGAVGLKGARDEIRALATRLGWVEGKDFFCAA